MKNIKTVVSYAAPLCEILNVKYEGVLCQSLTGTTVDDWVRDTETL